MLNDYFSFTKNERRGIIVLLSLILVISFLPRLYARFFSNSQPIDYASLSPLIAQWDSLKPVPIDTVLFKFNPNTATKEDFLTLGLPQKVVTNILNYRNKGGKFYKKEDFKKIWDLEEADYQRLLPYISIEANQNRDDENTYGFAEKSENSKGSLFLFDPNTASKEDFTRLGLPEKVANNIINYRNKGGKYDTKEKFKNVWGLTENDFNRLSPYIDIKVKKIDINTATASDFQELKGIGEKLSLKIINFRDKLGGFASIDQLGTTYGLPEETFLAIKPNLSINPSTIKKININTATVEELNAHPYINWNEAKLIIEYRNQHGNYKSTEEILNIKAFEKAFFDKIKPYLTI
jgi:competence ComEA-like helix-hairpin-helix protein